MKKKPRAEEKRRTNEQQPKSSFSDGFATSSFPFREAKPSESLSAPESECVPE
jgi:hypothetical protein